MTLLIALLLGVAVFGIGGLLEGLFWAVIIGAALLVFAVVTGFQVFTRTPSRM